MSKKIIGIDLGGTSVKFAILTQEGEVQEKWSIKTNILDEGSHIVDDMIESINHRLHLLNLSAEDFIGIGMGSPGVVDREKGTVIGAYNLNWKTLQPVKEKIEKATGISFFIDNDANVAALGERWKGAGENQPDVVFMTLGTGVGGGIVAEGKLLHGIAGAAGELGHITVDFDQPILCTCGKKGCLETVASATGIVNLTRRYADEYAGDAELKQLIDNGEDVNAKIVFDLAKAGDELALIVYRNFARYLGIACANIGSILNPSTIVIGGGVSAAGEFLLDGVRKFYEENSFPQVRTSTKLALATLGNDAGVIGAASLVLQ
ncbi:ROK family glucokinase [Streptococcus anginosus]|uniref:Glucokinase n=1 Tax=Streptococcus anginosus TaxID=1328 RepID=A0A3S4NIM8_STRAP|nr:ROK family glucokinase [Streptococcus anginosus]GAD40433.1 transcriptional regulator/sugar kinase [Streptococcus intermedius SK54 = ATCC 27335]EGL47685.1 ROK family protein [Streptococcus anginosus SK52 = DSM 20563]MBZ2156967.1 ROK family glucokinase [Streptococcus anginosus]ORE83499.1 glucokinase [Streptococcus anginosus SK52 = DSM 20563]UEB02635.1 ROK family glucokinase [Streptococcus anginosus subsp. anginosus]